MIATNWVEYRTTLGVTIYTTQEDSVLSLEVTDDYGDSQPLMQLPYPLREYINTLQRTPQ